MRWTRCPTCREPITWVPLCGSKKRIALEVNQVPDGRYVITANGRVKRWNAHPADVPRYAFHACPEND